MNLNSDSHRASAVLAAMATKAPPAASSPLVEQMRREAFTPTEMVWNAHGEMIWRYPPPEPIVVVVETLEAMPHLSHRARRLLLLCWEIGVL